VYTAALPFAPFDTALYRGFYDEGQFPWIVGGYERAWPPLSLALRHSETVRGLVFSPDGKQLVSSEQDTIHLWNLATGTEIISLSIQNGSTSSAAFSPDGTQIVSAWQILSPPNDKYVCTYDPSTGEQILGPLFIGDYPASSILFSPNGMLVAAGHRYAIYVWSAVSGSEVFAPLKLIGGSKCMLAFFPDSKRIASTFAPESTRDAQTICVWDASTGIQLLGRLQEHTG
jgi:WD40 repeat protein